MGVVEGDTRSLDFSSTELYCCKSYNLQHSNTPSSNSKPYRREGKPGLPKGAPCYLVTPANRLQMNHAQLPVSDLRIRSLVVLRCQLKLKDSGVGGRGGGRGVGGGEG